MSQAPPSYEVATRRDPLHLLAAYLPCCDLARASRVSRSWNAALSPALWSHPMGHFYSLAASHQFSASDVFHDLLHTLDRCSSLTRAAVYSLHIPPDHASHSYARGASLARTVALLPNLRSLIASNVDAFDHDVVSSLSSASSVHLRLLIARNCQNVTARSLSSLIHKLPQLLYLDLSYTKAGSSAAVVEALARSRDIRVLRLRHTGLKAPGLHQLLTASSEARSISALHSLDIRDNGLDLSVPSSLKFPAVSQPPSPCGHDVRSYESALRASTLGTYPSGEVYEADSLFGSGITHLYLSGNQNLAPELIAFSNPRVLDLASALVINYLDKDSAPSVWASIVANADDLIELRVFAPSLPHFALPVHHSPPSESESELPPSYEAAVGQQALPERLDVFLRSFDSLRTLRLSTIPAVATDGTILSTVTDLLRAAALAANDAQAQAQDDLHAGDLLPNETVAQRAKELFPLEQIILEVQPQILQDGGRSSLEDTGAELLWKAGQDDFSFFEDERSFIQTPALSNDAHDTAIDVVKSLTEWRNARKNAWLTQGVESQDGLASEYWPGQVGIMAGSLNQSNIVQEEEDPYSRSWHPLMAA